MEEHSIPENKRARTKAQGDMAPVRGTEGRDQEHVRMREWPVLWPERRGCQVMPAFKKCDFYSE